MTLRQFHGPRRVPPPPRAGSITGGMLAGLVAWLALPLTLAPPPGPERSPSWTLDRAGTLFPWLLACVVAGGALGPVLRLAPRRRAARRRAAMAAAGRRVVILGGGFGGVAAARRFEQRWRRAPGLEVTLVSKTNYLLFTPMLSEVAAGSLQPSSIGAPLRATCPRTRFVRAEVVGLDPAERAVQVRGLPGWLLWRALYLSRLPGTEKRLRVLLDWLIGILFPRDTTLASDLPPHQRQAAAGVSRPRRGSRRRVA